MRNWLLFSTISACAAGLAPNPSCALPAPPPEGSPAALTIEQIMARDWVGVAPANPYWADDGRAVYFEQRRAGSEVVDLYRVALPNGRPERVPATELAEVEGAGGAWTRDRRLHAYIRSGDLFVRARGSRSARQLTRTAEVESAPVVLADGRIAFRRGDDLHAIDLESGLDSTLAELRLAKDPDEKPDRTGFLSAEQLRLFDVLAERDRRKEEKRAADRAGRTADPSRSPLPFFLGEGLEIERLDLSSSGKYLLVVLAKTESGGAPDNEGATGGKPDSMPVFITESGYVETRKIRPKVGTGTAETPKLWLLDLAQHTRTELSLDALPGLSDDPLAELRRAAAKEKNAEAGGEAKSSPASEPAAKARPVSLGGVTWNEDGSRLALQLFSADNKDRWIALATPGTSAVTSLLHESDPAWLGWRFTDFGWMPDGRSVWYLSEASGFSHLYLEGVGIPRRALTQGPFEVDHPRLARDGKSFFVSANREAPGIYEAYRVRIDSPALERLTTTGGMTYAIPSPDERELLLTSSWPTRPPELFVQAMRAGSTPRPLTATTTAAFLAVPWTAPEIVQIRSSHFPGNLQARVYTPATAAGGLSPAVLFVHGAGYLQNAHQGWSDYFREFMFHTLLARAGYVVLDMDYRASSGYGRDFRTAIYRQMGEPELEDLEDGVAWLAAQRGVDPKRVGVYGGSYGGFLTMMALFKRPELFAAGAALRPVTDWAHYNHGYTSAILNTPEVDPEAYRRSSPIEFASGLSRPLLICHGMVDDNVAFQDTVRLVQRLIELGKTDLFETAIYPFEPHGFKEPTSWVDEYKRIFRLFETHLK